MLKLRALDHIGLKVADMDRSLAFYCGILGLELLRRRARGDAGVESAVLRVGAQEMNIFSNPGCVAAHADGDAGGVDHFCFEVDCRSIDAVVGALGRAGVAITQPPVQRSDGVSLFVSDPDGCRVELIVKNES